jgi:hypothetical protein
VVSTVHGNLNSWTTAIPPRRYAVIGLPYATNRSERAQGIACTRWEGEGPKIRRAPFRKGALEPANIAGLEAEGQSELDDAWAGDSCENRAVLRTHVNNAVVPL